MKTVGARLVAALVLAVVASGNARAFDYYVLSLSWSPQHCRTHPAGDHDPQCGIGHHFGFVVHGLWPQFEKGGFPSSCSNAAVSDAVVASMMDIMPSEQLIEHEWEKHGTCSGLDPAAYFQAARAAFAAVRIPDRYQAPPKAFSIAVNDLHADFATANPAFPSSSLAMVCTSGALTEVHACLTKDLAPRACGKGVGDACHGMVAVQPVAAGGGEPTDGGGEPTSGGGVATDHAEYAIRWQAGTGGPKSAKAVLNVLGRTADDTDEYEVEYYDFTVPADVPAGVKAILRRRVKGQKHQLTYKLRADHPLASFTCPLPGAESEPEVDVTVLQNGVARSYSAGCSLESSAGPVPVPAALNAHPKGCVSTMVRRTSKTLKVEEWRLPSGRSLLEVSTKGPDSKKALKGFRRDVADKLLKASIKPSTASKTEAGSDCD